jgi:hypothetical protein
MMLNVDIHVPGIMGGTTNGTVQRLTSAAPHVSLFVEMQDKLATAEDKAMGLEARVSQLQSLLQESEVSCVATPVSGFQHVPCACNACCLANCCAQSVCCLADCCAQRHVASRSCAQSMLCCLANCCAQRPLS